MGADTNANTLGGGALELGDRCVSLRHAAARMRPRRRGALSAEAAEGEVGR